MNTFIIDDNSAMREALGILLEGSMGSISCFSHPKEARDQTPSPDLILLDMNYAPGLRSGKEGLFWLRKLVSAFPKCCIVPITAYGELELAVQCLQAGATDFVLKPWENQKLLKTLTSALKLKESKINSSISPSASASTNDQSIKAKETNFIGKSPPIKSVLKMVERVAKTDASVLILGEHGTGKELIANELHRQSPRNTQPLVTVDMGAIPENLFESELFGHEKGAFTDARQDRKGKFELANGGTLFLDEIGNLPLTLQRKLLVALQRREIYRVGGNKPIAVDIRLICATNSHLASLIQKGQFREDLLYRINTIQIEVPPLRERGQDIITLANYFLKQFSQKYGRPNLHFVDKTETHLMHYHWPGNVRELEHAVEKAVILAEQDELSIRDFPFVEAHGQFEQPQTLEEMERQMIIKALTQHNRNMTAVAQQLGITRQTLYNKLKKFGL